MKKYSSKMIKISGYLMFLMVYLNSSLALAQHTPSNEEHILVPYNTPFSYDLEQATRWELKSPTGVLLKSGIGSLENELLQEPGEYQIQLHAVHDPNTCDHGALPEKLVVKVSTMKMVFDFSTVQLSRNITAASVQGITVRVAVDFSSYRNQEVLYKERFVTAGVGTSIVGKLKNGPIMLQPGVNILEFTLEGQATSGNYIMFDFVDINGEVQAYGLTQMIQ